ncbi:MAG: anthranilate phosphoribosyltransferase [Treponematales bacterium]
MIKEAIGLAAKRENLGYDMALASMNEIMEGKASDIQMAAFLTALIEDYLDALGMACSF